jgi:hypothetical protein
MQLGKERPKTKEEIEKEKKELLKYIKVNATTYSISSNQVKKEYKDLEKKLGIEFEPCVYEYIDFICNFYNKYHKRWYDSYKVLDNLFQTDVEFEYIFSFPDANFSYEVSNISEGSMVIAGDPSLRDHSWCFWEINEGIYDYPLGFGHEGKTLGESVSKMAEGWIVKDLNKIKEPGVRQVAEEHNKILQEFITKVPK